jgi:hypothetical protein
VRQNWSHYLASIAGLLVGLASFVLLLSEGVPGTEGASRGKEVTLSHTKSSGCPERCSKPEHTKTKVSVSNTPASPAEDPSLIEKAIDNDAGVLVIRLLVALLAALTTMTTLERLLRAPNGAAPAERRDDTPPDDRGNPAELSPTNSPSSGSGAADTKAAEEARKAEKAKLEGEKVTVRKRQGLLRRGAAGKRKPEAEL